MKSPPNLLPPDLTADEERVLPFLCAGWKNHAIALELGLADAAVERHTGSCLQKFGADCRLRLAERLLQAGLQAEPPR